MSAISVTDPTVIKMDSFDIKRKNMGTAQDCAVNTAAKLAHLEQTSNVTFKRFIRENDLFVPFVMTHLLQKQTGSVIVKTNIS